MKRPGLLFGLGLLGVGVIAALAVDGAQPEHTGGRFTASDPKLRQRRRGRRRHAMEWMDRVIERVSEHEGRYDSLNRDTDGAGLSYGILQWTQKTGDLAVLLAAMFEADANAFKRIFGPKWAELLELTKNQSREPLDGGVLWKDPWVDRFREAGRYPVFQAVQRKLARKGVHFRGAVDVSKIMGVATERAMALFFDTAVQQGAGASRQVARRVKAHFEQQGRTSVPYGELLRAYAQGAADRLRRTTDPKSQPRSKRLSWVKVGNEWHLFARNQDLYAGVHRRRFAILADERLEDVAVTVA